MARALEEPLKQIALNAGLEGGVIVEKVRSLKGADGLNAATGEYEDLVKAGVIDAAKVTRSALQNAASIAALFLTTEAVVADKPEPKRRPPACLVAAWAAWEAWTSRLVRRSPPSGGDRSPASERPWAGYPARRERARQEGAPSSRPGVAQVRRFDTSCSSASSSSFVPIAMRISPARIC